MENNKYIKAIKDYINKNYRKCFRNPVEGILDYPFLVPGASYENQLWDWDSWLTGYAIMDIENEDSENYQKGCILNFLSKMDNKGRIPVLIDSKNDFWVPRIDDNYHGNIHKPCLAIHTLEISKKYNDVKWIEKDFDKLLSFIHYYEKEQKDVESGLFFWNDDFLIGFDNDPTVFYRPDKSSGALYLNCLMVEELKSIGVLADLLNRIDIKNIYNKKAEELIEAIKKECYDPIDGCFYSADLSLRKIDKNEWKHSGCPRQYKTLPIKIKTWASMLPLYCGVASEKQAEQLVKIYQDKNGLFSEFGIRSVAKNEKMYNVVVSNNPSCWTGPIWVVANYLTYVGLRKYGYEDLAKDLAYKTIKLLGEDVINNGEFHEYYDPDTGKGVTGKGFQSWNFLVLKMINDLKD